METVFAEAQLKKGDLQGALNSLQDLVRAQPSNAEYRIFLFQLLAIMGQWERALNQLDVIGGLDAGALAMVAMYRQVIACEQARESVFKGEAEPSVSGQPEEWLALLIQAVSLTASGQFAASQDLRNKAFELAPAVSGSINGSRFDWLADGDTRLGPVLEAIIEGRYCWLPMTGIRRIVLEKPLDLRDLIWLPAHFTWVSGEEAFGVIPARYPGTECATDPLAALGKKTLWQDCGDGLFLGTGQKVLTTPEDEYPLLEIRDIEFNCPVEAAGDIKDDNGRVGTRG